MRKNEPTLAFWGLDTADIWPLEVGVCGGQINCGGPYIWPESFLSVLPLLFRYSYYSQPIAAWSECVLPDCGCLGRPSKVQRFANFGAKASEITERHMKFHNFWFSAVFEFRLGPTIKLVRCLVTFPYCTHPWGSTQTAAIRGYSTVVEGLYIGFALVQY